MNDEQSQAAKLAAWLDARGGPLPDDVDDDVLEGALALRPELAPPPSLSADDILAEVRAGPLASRPVVEPPALPAPANTGGWRRWVGAGTVGALAAAAALVLVVGPQGARMSPPDEATVALPQAHELAAPEADAKAAPMPAVEAPPVDAAPPAAAKADAAGRSELDGFPVIGSASGLGLKGEGIGGGGVAEGGIGAGGYGFGAGRGAAPKAPANEATAGAAPPAAPAPGLDAENTAPPAPPPPAAAPAAARDDALEALGYVTDEEVVSQTAEPVATRAERARAPSKPAAKTAAAAAPAGAYAEEERAADGDSDWRAGASPDVVRRAESAIAAAEAQVQRGDPIGAATSLRAWIAAPASVGQHAAVLAGQWALDGGDLPLASDLVERGLRLSSAPSADRDALLRLQRAIATAASRR